MVSKEKWRLLWNLILGTPHIGANITVTLSLVPITMHLPPSLQVSQSATQCMTSQKFSSACNTPYDLRCVASYQPPPSYFYPTGKTRASIPTEHWCEITQNTAPRLASSPRQNSHMQCQPCGRVYNVISQFLQPHLEHGYYCCLEQRSTIAFNWCLTELAANTAKEYPRSSLWKKSVPRKWGHRPHHQPRLPPAL